MSFDFPFGRLLCVR